MSSSGVQNTGPGTINIGNSAIGDHATVYADRRPRPEESTDGDAAGRRADVGVITVLSEETNAVATALRAAGSVRSHVHEEDGSHCDEVEVDVHGRRLLVAATQVAKPGQHSAVIAFHRLQRNHAPAVVALVGIAAGVHPSVRLGDVVVVQDVIYYDLRKETAGGTVRRGQERSVPVRVKHAINHFFSGNGEPYRASFKDPDGDTRQCSVLRGLAGSGEAVVAYAHSDIRRYIEGFNDKTLALETEAGGVAEAFYEMAGNFGTQGWLAIRGISDYADADKNDDYHNIASWHAAAVLIQLLPYLIA
jgi:adenosylhomocysteine nucleosidase